MGLMRKMLRGASKGIDFAQRVTDALNESKQAEDKMPPVTMFPKFDEEPIEIPIGKYECKIYTYDGRPLPNMAVGSIINMKVTATNCPPMKGIYRGGECDGQDAMCVGYMGHAVGYIFKAYGLDECMERHKVASIAVRFDGIDDGGWQNLIALLPDDDWFEIDEIKSRFGEDVKTIDFNLYDNVWVGPPVSGECEMHIEFEEPVGNRKPVVLLYLQDALCARINARTKAYKTVCELANHEIIACQVDWNQYKEGPRCFTLRAIYTDE